jgi:hypothetical protein
MTSSDEKKNNLERFNILADLQVQKRLQAVTPDQQEKARQDIRKAREERDKKLSDEKKKYENEWNERFRKAIAERAKKYPPIEVNEISGSRRTPSEAQLRSMAAVDVRLEHDKIIDNTHDDFERKIDEIFKHYEQSHDQSADNHATQEHENNYAAHEHGGSSEQGRHLERDHEPDH